MLTKYPPKKALECHQKLGMITVGISMPKSLNRALMCVVLSITYGI